MNKWTFGCCVIAFSFVSVTACLSPSPKAKREVHGAQVEALLKEDQPLQLRRMSSANESEFKGYFFLGSGSVSGQGVTRITFAWAIEPNNYVFSTLPIDRIRVVTDEKVDGPVVAFHLIPFNNWGRQYSYLQQAIDAEVEYVTIRCKDSDWSMKVTLPLNQ